jgi:hypothetical protein
MLLSAIPKNIQNTLTNHQLLQTSFQLKGVLGCTRAARAHQNAFVLDPFLALRAARAAHESLFPEDLFQSNSFHV